MERYHQLSLNVGRCSAAGPWRTSGLRNLRKERIEGFADRADADQLAFTFAGARRRLLVGARGRPLIGRARLQPSVWLDVRLRHHAAPEPHLGRLPHTKGGLRDPANLSREADF